MLSSFIKNYKKSNPIRFDTGRRDITELVDDSFPALLIQQAQQKAASFYGAKAVRFLTTGSSIGIKSAILACGGNVISFSGAHQAIEEGCVLAQCTMHNAQCTIVNDLFVVPSASDVEEAIKKYPNAKAVYIESPDYYGRVVDSAVAEVIKKEGKLFFCDGAHGAHFAIDSGGLFPKGFESVADVCNLSAHKTLGALTGGAFLCINNLDLLNSIDNALKNLGSTSPNYTIMASLEDAIDNAVNSINDYKRLHKDIENFKKDIPCLKNQDFSRIVVDSQKLGYNNGKDLCQTLATKHNIYAEKHKGKWAVFIATPENNLDDLELLKKALIIS